VFRIMRYTNIKIGLFAKLISRRSICL